MFSSFFVFISFLALKSKISSSHSLTYFGDDVISCPAGQFCGTVKNPNFNQPFDPVSYVNNFGNPISENIFFDTRAFLNSCLNCSPGKYKSSASAENCISMYPDLYYYFSTTLSSTTSYSSNEMKYQTPYLYSACISDYLGVYTKNCSENHQENLFIPKLCFNPLQNPQPPTSCDLCPAGQYSDTFGSISCSLCPSGTYSPHIGSTNNATCIECPINTYSNSQGSSRCSSCPYGTYSNSGASYCLEKRRWLW